MRDQLTAISIAFQHAPLVMRDRFSLPNETVASRLGTFPPSYSERLILSTCNRLELYAVAPTASDGAESLITWLATEHDVPAQSIRQCATVLRQHDAVCHLYRVAAGLESMVLGEPQILTQIRDALAAARAAGTAGPVLNRLTTSALHVGKRARTDTGIARNRNSLAHVAVDVAASELHGLRGRRAAVIGAGQTGTLTARVLRGADLADLVVLNRSPDRGRRLAAAVGGRYAPLAELPAELATVDLAIAAASVSSPIIAKQSVLQPRARANPLLAIDLGVPRNIDPAVEAIASIRVIDLDALQPYAVARQHDYSAEIREVESLVATATADFMMWWESRPVVTTIAALREQADTIRATELDAALRKLNHLSARDRNVVAALSVALVNKLLHQPTTALRETERPDVATQVAAELFGLSPAPHPYPVIPSRSEESLVSQCRERQSDFPIRSK